MKARTLTLLAAAALVALPLLAQPPGGGGPPGPPDPPDFGERMVQQLTRLLELTPAQHDQLVTFTRQLETTVRPLRQQERANHEQLRTLLEGANPDPAAVGRLVIANKGLQEQIKTARQAFDTAFTAILSAEQQMGYEVFKKMAFHRQRRGPGGPGGQGAGELMQAGPAQL